MPSSPGLCPVRFTTLVAVLQREGLNNCLQMAARSQISTAISFEGPRPAASAAFTARSGGQESALSAAAEGEGVVLSSVGMFTSGCCSPSGACFPELASGTACPRTYAGWTPRTSAAPSAQPQQHAWVADPVAGLTDIHSQEDMYSLHNLDLDEPPV